METLSEYKWNSIKPDKSPYADIVWELFQQLKSWLPWLEYLQGIKETLTLEELNKKYIGYLFKYKKYRTAELELILSNSGYYQAVKDFAKKNVLFDILIDGYSIDVNRNDPRNSRILPILPYPNQLKLIHDLEYSKKNIFVEKSRRGGASMLMSFRQRRNLLHKENFVMAVANKSKEDTDRGKNDMTGNSSMTRLDLMLDHSIFMPEDWRDARIYNTAELREKNQAIYRSHKPSILVMRSNKIEGVVMGKGTATGQAIHEFYLDELDVFADEHPNMEKEIFSAFASSANRLIIYSTYRSINYSMYRIREKNDTEHWDFERLYWRDNPTCNTPWFESQVSRMDSATQVARELEIDPTASIEGRVLPNLEKGVNVLSADEIKAKVGDFWNLKHWERYIFADNGGTASQSYVKAFFHRASNTVVLFDGTVIGDRSINDLKQWFDEDTFGWEGRKLFADMAIKHNHTFNHHSTAFLLMDEGFTVNLVDNTHIHTIHDTMRDLITKGKLFVCSDNVWFTNQILSYRYKETGVVDKKGSHIGDACSYGIRAIYYNGYTGLV